MVAPEQLSEVVVILQSWGYTEEDLAEVLVGNLLRLLN